MSGIGGLGAGSLRPPPPPTATMNPAFPPFSYATPGYGANTTLPFPTAGIGTTVVPPATMNAAAGVPIPGAVYTYPPTPPTGPSTVITSGATGPPQQVVVDPMAEVIDISLYNSDGLLFDGNSAGMLNLGTTQNVQNLNILRPAYGLTVSEGRPGMTSIPAVNTEYVGNPLGLAAQNPSDLTEFGTVSPESIFYPDVPYNTQIYQGGGPGAAGIYGSNTEPLPTIDGVPLTSTGQTTAELATSQGLVGPPRPVAQAVPGETPAGQIGALRPPPVPPTILETVGNIVATILADYALGDIYDEYTVGPLYPSPQVMYSNQFAANDGYGVQTLRPSRPLSGIIAQGVAGFNPPPRPQYGNVQNDLLNLYYGLFPPPPANDPNVWPQRPPGDASVWDTPGSVYSSSGALQSGGVNAKV